jgi:transposase
MGAMPANVRKPSPSALTDEEGALIAPSVPRATSGGHPKDHHKRTILQGIFDVLRSGGAWLMWPHDVPPWQSV